MQADLDKKWHISMLLDYYGELLSDRQREIAVYYHNDDLSLGEIAELMGITRQGVRDALKKSEAILLSCEEKLGIVARFGKLQKRLEEIASSLPEQYSEIAHQLRSLNL